MKKVYKANNNLTVPIVVDGKIVKYVSFTDENKTFITVDEVEQTALESLGSFGTLYKLVETVESKPVETKREPSEYAEVTSLSEAKDVLRTDFEVSHQQLRTPASIMAKAEELNISFPNLKLEL